MLELSKCQINPFKTPIFRTVVQVLRKFTSFEGVKSLKIQFNNFIPKHAGKSSKYAGFCFISYQFLPQNSRKSVLILGRITFQPHFSLSFFLFYSFKVSAKKGDSGHFVREREGFLKKPLSPAKFKTETEANQIKSLLLYFK